MVIYPNLYVSGVEKITLEILKKNNIKALILDADNTLIDYNKNISESVIKWAKELQTAGIKMYILSNTNKREKIEKISKKLNIKYELFAKKPFKSGFLKVKNILKEDEKNIATVGDQIFTDIIRRESLQNVYNFSRTSK